MSTRTLPLPASALTTVRRALAVAGPADDLAEVVGVDLTSSSSPRRALLATHDDILVVVDDALDEVLERLLEHAWDSFFSEVSVLGLGLGGHLRLSGVLAP